MNKDQPATSQEGELQCTCQRNVFGARIPSKICPVHNPAPSQDHQAASGTPRNKYDPSSLNHTVHELKTWPEYFESLLSGSKTFEARKDDRNFKVGDDLRLMEWDPKTVHYTGRRLVSPITYILRDTEHVAKGYCILGILGPGSADLATSQRLVEELREQLEEVQKCIPVDPKHDDCVIVLRSGFNTVCWLHRRERDNARKERDELKATVEAQRRELAKMQARGVSGEGSEDCPFCKHYPATGHAQQVPMCAMCQLESERENILANSNADDRDAALTERDALRETVRALECDKIRLEGERIESDSIMGRISSALFNPDDNVNGEACIKRIWDVLIEASYLREQIILLECYRERVAQEVDSVIAHIPAQFVVVDPSDRFATLAISCAKLSNTAIEGAKDKSRLDWLDADLRANVDLSRDIMRHKGEWTARAAIDAASTTETVG